MPYSWSRRARSAGLPLTWTAPSRFRQVADDPEERRLAAAGRPDQGDEFAGLHVEVDAVQRGHACPEPLGDSFERDRFHATCSGARFKTRRSSRTTARKNVIPSSAQATIVAQKFAG